MRSFTEKENLQRAPWRIFFFFLVIGESRVLFGEVAFEVTYDVKNTVYEIHTVGCIMFSRILMLKSLPPYLRTQPCLELGSLQM